VIHTNSRTIVTSGNGDGGESRKKKNGVSIVAKMLYNLKK
jgi:hypothetical protein